VALLLVAAIAVGCDRPLVRPGSTFRPTPSPSPTFVLEETGLDGRVVDEAGQPLAGVSLVIRIGRFRGTAASTDEGTFSDRGTLGDMEITASLEGYETVETTVTVVPNEIAELEIVLAEE
jgi:hypothetical protein